MYAVALYLCTLALRTFVADYKCTYCTQLTPFAIEQYGRFGAKALKLVHRISTPPQVMQGLLDYGYRTHDPTTGNPYRMAVGKVKTWIMQRIFTALMQGMAACVHERLDNIQRDRNPPEFRGLPRGLWPGWLQPRLYQHPAAR